MMRERVFRVAIRQFGPFESAIRKQWAAFEEKESTGLELQAEAFDLHPLTQRLFADTGLLSGDWDVAFINTDWVASLHANREVLDLAGWLAKDAPEDYPEGWTPSLLRLQQIEGAVLGLPYHDGPECLIYRKDLFEDAAEQKRFETQFGAPLRVPQTWEEFRRVAGFFQRPEQRLYGTVFAGFPDGHNTVYDFLLQLWTRGGELLDENGQINFVSPEAEDAVSFYREMLSDSGAAHPDCREMDSVKSGMAFAAGEVAMMVNWFGFAAMAETITESRVRGKVDVANVPRGRSGASTSLNIYWILSIPAGTPHRKIAYRFLRHCAGSEMDKLLTLEGGIGCRKSTWADAAVNRTIPFYNRLEGLHAIAREIPQVAEWPRIAAVIDDLMSAAGGTSRPVADLLQDAKTQTVSRSGPPI
jgi:multiple sugar transport system substrate-binding protein